MDRKFIRSLHEIRENLKANKISVNEVVKYSDRYQKYADEVLEEEKSGKISKEFMNSLEDYLMICLDVYTYSENGDVLIPDYTYDMVMNVYCDHTHNERLVYADYIMSTMLWPFVKHEAPFMVGTISRKIYDVNTLASYLQHRGFLLYRNTRARYFSDGTDFFRDLIAHGTKVEIQIIPAQKQYDMAKVLK